MSRRDTPDLPAERIDIVQEKDRVRLVHRPSGDSVSRKHSLEGADVRPWFEHLKAFLAAHPRAHAVCDQRGRIVGDAQDYPAAGGGFAVGDLVVTLQSHAEPVARRVMSVFEDGPRFQREADLAPFAYRLEDGNILRYRQIEATWEARTLTGGIWETRRLLPTDDLDAIRIPVAASLLQGILQAQEALRDESGIRKRIQDGRPGDEDPRVRDIAETANEALLDAEEPLWKKDAGDEAVQAGLRALVAARAAMGELAPYEPVPEEGARDRRVAPFHLARADAVIQGLQDRGLALEDAPAAPTP